jgi:hypothetical protein
MVRLAPAACARFTPTGQITAAQAEFASPPLCLQADDDGRMTLRSCDAGARQQWRMEADGVRAGGRIRLASTNDCITAGAVGALARVARCGEGGPQRFVYHRGGALSVAAGLCLASDTGKVGNGGLIGQQGARMSFQACKAYAPEQVFSAPHASSPVD